MGQGLRRRPGHAEGVRAGGAPAGPDAGAGRRLPRGRARGRDGRRVRLLPARQGRRGPEHRHRHARPGRRRARRPPAPGLRDRHRHRGGRRGADQGDLRRQGGLGALAAARLPARPGHRRDQGGEPAGGRLHPRRARHHRVGGDLGGVRGQLAVDHRHRGGLHRRAHQGRAVRAGAGGLRRVAGDRAAGPRGRPGPDAALDRLVRPADGRALHRLPTWCWTSWPPAEHPRLAALGTSCPDHFLRTKVKPLVLDLPPTASVEESITRLRELHEAYRADYQALLRPQRRPPTRRPSAAPTR